MALGDVARGVCAAAAIFVVVNAPQCGGFPPTSVVPKFSNSLNNLPPLPTPINFMCQLLNMTVSGVYSAAKTFGFIDTNSIDKIRILQYQQDGAYRNYSCDSNDIPIDPSEPFKVIIHGWRAEGNSTWIKEMALAYHHIGVRQVLSVEWSSLASKDYVTAASSTRKIGQHVAEMIWHRILKNQTSQLNNVHVIGHSLGAQTAGFLGKHVSNLAGGEVINKISALDAAAPLFEYPLNLPSTDRISAEDARFVESVHTNAGFLGFLSAFANHDYYVSFGGPVQPGCLDGIDIFNAFLCSHSRSHEIFNKTITSDKYLARYCDSPLLAFANLCNRNPLVIMGENNNSTESDGQYFLLVDKDNEPGEPKSKNLFDDIFG
ncbi:phospholipase A1 3-like isoform X2 [Cylas formicarius]|uniref:phospholipase A1 3-like isoform X2 n=1 Tax=Cylas formicarius TaxID=197179 RepID=UPI002958C96C|nr:phospholipase A1 3-like isoform X2 [Cylas formicarius]